jgi:phage FluMu gp28-like protein
LASEKLSFLPYQQRWLKDESRIKIWEKSRRIGATYVQAYEDVRDCLKKTVPAVWFSSADLTAAAEYIGYCAKWARAFGAAAKDLGEVVLDEKKGVKAYVLELANGTKIHALSSNPSAFRSKGGKVVLDEYAFHDDPDAMWAAARPCITWGFPLRILSTHNGKSCKYYKFVESCRGGSLKWSLHSTDIFKAVAEGLADKIAHRKLSEEERKEWIQNEHDNCGDENAWQQEYCCNAIDEATAFLTYEMISKCELEESLLLREIDKLTGDATLGYDVARSGNLSVMWVLEKVGLLKMTRGVWAMKNWKFARQRELLYKIMERPCVHRACIDQTGIGMQIAEEAQDKFGHFRVEPVTFTNKAKEEIAQQLYIAFEDVSVRVPATFAVREDLHAIRKYVTAAGNVRYDAAVDTKTGSHADHFWALGLANYAISKDRGPISITSGSPRESVELFENYG